MRTQKERLSELHKRVEGIRRRKQKAGAVGLGVFCVCVFTLLVRCIVWLDDSFHNIIDVDMQGASLLSDNAGGYVLAGVIAFFAGVVITTIIIRSRKK